MLKSRYYAFTFFHKPYEFMFLGKLYVDFRSDINIFSKAFYNIIDLCKYGLYLGLYDSDNIVRMGIFRHSQVLVLSTRNAS